MNHVLNVNAVSQIEGKEGRLSGSVVERLPLAQGMILES